MNNKRQKLLISLLLLTVFVTPVSAFAQEDDSSDEDFAVPVSVDLKINGQNSALTVPKNTRIAVSWESEGAVSCKTSWSTAPQKIVGRITGKISASRTFTVTCRGEDGTEDSDSIRVTVGKQGSSAPTSTGSSSLCNPFSRDVSVETDLRADEIVALGKVLFKLGLYPTVTFDKQDFATGVADFQAKYGIRKTGTLDSGTRAKLNSLSECPRQSDQSIVPVHLTPPPVSKPPSIIVPTQATQTTTQPSCTIAAAPNPVTLNSSVVLSWTSQKANYAAFVLDTSGKDVLQLPGDKLAANGSQAITASVVGNPTITLQVIGANGSNTCFTTFTIIAPTVITPPPAYKPLVCGQKGDVNGDGMISEADRDLIRSFVGGSATLSETQQKNADVNASGGVSNLDSTFIGEYLFGTRSTFPGCSTASTQPSITVLSPNGGESFSVGDTVSIRWSVPEVPTGATITLNVPYVRFGVTYNGTIASNLSPDSKGGYQWRIPSEYLATGLFDQFKMKVTLVNPSGKNWEDYSDSFFTITAPTATPPLQPPPPITVSAQPSITVLSPSGGESFTPGQSVTVRYTATPNSHTLHISLLPVGTNVTGPILVQNAPNTGSTAVTIPANTTPGSYIMNVAVIDPTKNSGPSNNSNAFTITVPIVTTPAPPPVSASKSLVCGSLGDVNGDGAISSADVDLVRAFILGTAAPTVEQTKNADVNGSGDLSGLDTTGINGYLAGTSSTFPGCAIPAPVPPPTPQETTPPPPPAPTYVPDLLSFSAISANEDKSSGSTFAPGGGADWSYTSTLSLGSAKTIKSMRITAGSEVWTTMPEGSYWNIVIFDGGTQINSAPVDNLNLAAGSGSKSFTLYTQKWNQTFNPSYTLTVTFTDGTTLTAPVSGSPVSFWQPFTQFAAALFGLQDWGR